MKTKEELIQDYLEGQLSETDRARFDEFFREDEAFREDVRLQENLRRTLGNRVSKESEAEALRASFRRAEDKLRGAEDKLRGAEDKLRREDRPNSTRLRVLIPWLAAASVLIGAVLFFFPSGEDRSLYELPPMRSEIVRGVGSSGAEAEEKAAYEEAVLAYNKGLYQKSTKILRELQTQRPENTQRRYYLGLSMIGEGNYREAIPLLGELASGESVFKEESRYYLAIAMAESGNREEAIRLIESIPDSSSVYPKAQRLLKKLRGT